MIKFVINFYGPFTLELEYWFQIKDVNESLENIEQKSIDKIINENKIKGIKDYNNGYIVILLMNEFIGNKYKEMNLMNFLMRIQILIKIVKNIRIYLIW